MRGIERWGASDMMERAFQGFQQLTGPGMPQTAWEILGIPVNAPLGLCTLARNNLARRYHPDNGSEPNAEMMARVNEAYSEISS